MIRGLRRLAPWCWCLCLLGCGRSYRDVGIYEPTEPKERAAPSKSSGCGRALPPEQMDFFSNFHVDQTGATLADPQPTRAGERQFYVQVPDDYDRERPYRVVYQDRRECNGRGALDTTAKDLSRKDAGGDDQAVYVDVLGPIDGLETTCYDTDSGDDSIEYEAFALMHEFVESHYCVDNDRIFVEGVERGGALANLLGCYFAGTDARQFSPRWSIRGRAVVDGWLPESTPTPCNGPGAAIWLQAPNDNAAQAALALALESNGCDETSVPWAPAAQIAGLAPRACQLYTGCDADTRQQFPLVYCTADQIGGAARAALAIPTFTAFFDSLDPTP